MRGGKIYLHKWLRKAFGVCLEPRKDLEGNPESVPEGAKVMGHLGFCYIAPGEVQALRGWERLRCRGSGADVRRKALRDLLRFVW